MKEFVIQSSISENQLSFLRSTASSMFIIKISSTEMTVQREDLFSTGSYEWLTDFFEGLASQDKPWQDIKDWESWEKEFRISATCTSLGQVYFDIQLASNPEDEEAWVARFKIRSDFGALPQLAKNAKAIFGPGPNAPDF